MYWIEGNVNKYVIGLSDDDLRASMESNSLELERVLNKNVRLFSVNLVSTTVHVSGLLYVAVIVENILVLKLK